MAVILTSSDFSFVERTVIDLWIWLWFIQRVWKTDKFASLEWNRIRNFDLKSIITLLIFLMLPVQTIFDTSWIYLKYNEGYVVDSNDEIVSKPSYLQNGTSLWSHKNIIIKTVTEYVLTFAFAFQIGTLALLQAFWSHLSSQMGGKPFMRSWEFRFYVSWVFVSMIIFPAARFFSSQDPVLIETVPQLLFAIQLFIIFLLGIINGRRLDSLLKSIQQNTSSSGRETLRRIHYFIEMNKLLMFGVLLISVSLSLISFYTIVIHKLVLSKFWLDLLIIHTNFGSLILWATMILIVYPRYYITGTIMNNSHNNFFLKDHRNVSVTSLETGNIQKSEIGNKQVISTTTTTTMTMTATTSRPMRVKGHSVQKSINSLLEEQKQQIESFRHKTSMSISSTATLASSHTPSSPLISPLSPSVPPPPLFPPPIAHYENDTKQYQ